MAAERTVWRWCGLLLDRLNPRSVSQEVSDQQFSTTEYRFPVNTPDTKEGYYYRAIFEEYFPQESAAKCVPGGKSVACSTVEALEWDESFKNMADPSGRSVVPVHNG